MKFIIIIIIIIISSSSSSSSSNSSSSISSSSIAVVSVVILDAARAVKPGCLFRDIQVHSLIIPINRKSKISLRTVICKRGPLEGVSVENVGRDEIRQMFIRRISASKIILQLC